MKQSLKFIPWFFLYTRLCTAFFFIVIGIIPSLTNIKLCLFLFWFGFLGDILDGVVARYLKTDTEIMRRLDSLFDFLFWLSTTFLLYMNFKNIKEVVLYGAGSVLTIVCIEYVTCFLRFGKNPSAHNWSSKVFGVFLFTLYTFIFLGFSPISLGYITFGIGVFARLDSFVIYLILREWTHDIPSFYHAYLIRNGTSSTMKAREEFDSNTF